MNNNSNEHDKRSYNNGEYSDPVYSVEDMLDVLKRFEDPGMVSEAQMNGMYFFVSELTGMSIDKIDELMSEREEEIER